LALKVSTSEETSFDGGQSKALSNWSPPRSSSLLQTIRATVAIALDCRFFLHSPMKAMLSLS